VLPLLFSRLQGVAIAPGFQMRPPPPLAFLGAAVMGCVLWVLAYNLIILCQRWGIATLSLEKLQEARPGITALIERWRAMPIAFVLLAFAIVPAVGEEFFFRGYLLGALRGRLPAWAAIGANAVVFGLFHASVGGIIAIERVLSSALLGAALGWVCWSSRSIWPGVLLHALNNSLMLLIARYGERLKALGWDAEHEHFLPPLIVAIAVAGVLVGSALVWLGRRQPAERSAGAADANSPLPLGDG
jgi:membrane protease YdiL (CAAX protease family)